MIKFGTKELLFALAIAAASNTSMAETLVVVAHPSLQESLTQEQVRRIYLGKTTQMPDGTQATPLLLDKATAKQSNAQFARSVLMRSTKQLKSYWAKRLFTGKSKPPLVVGSFQQMKQLIAENQGYIGYILLSDIDDSVKTVFIATDS